MSTLNDTPLLSREILAAALPGSGLDVQSERVRITPGPIPQDEISRMWATFSTGYRISVTYDVAVVLIDSRRPMTRPLPVLTRGVDDTGPQVGEGHRSLAFALRFRAPDRTLTEKDTAAAREAAVALAAERHGAQQRS